MFVRTEQFVRRINLTTAALAGVLFLALLPVNAQQPAAAGVKEVPDNVAEHTPPVQPIPYSHKTHLALGLPCATCHTNPEPGNMMTFPETATCMTCHGTIATDKPSIQKLASYAKSGQPVPWVRVYMITKGVNWSHRKHLDAGMKCETCHGPVAELAAMSQITAVTSMGVCINCHKLNSAPTVCQTCHAWPSN